MKAGKVNPTVRDGMKIHDVQEANTLFNMVKIHTTPEKTTPIRDFSRQLNINIAEK